MKAACWFGTHDIRVKDVADPRILNPRDAIVRLSLTTICGSDLHLYDGYVPSLEKGDILGHEIVGEVVDVGREVKQHAIGDRVVVGSVIACGNCWHCRRKEFALCDNSNPNAGALEKLYGFAPAAFYGYSHLFGGYAGAQAEYVRVPFADVGAFRVPEEMTDEQALMCSDVFPTGFMAADLCGIQGHDIVAVWGCGPIGLFSIKSAMLLGAERVVAIDSVPARLEMARKIGAIPLDQRSIDVPAALEEMTAGRGVDACIDAVGMEAHGTNLLAEMYDKTKQALMLETDRADVLRQVIQCCRKGGVVSIIGVYSMFVDKFPMGAAFNKGLTLRMGQQHGQKYMPRLFDYWRDGKIDPSFIITHRLPLEDANRAYKTFRDKKENCVKVVLQP